MIHALRNLREKYAWDIANDCLSRCSDLLDKITALCVRSNTTDTNDQGLAPMDMDLAALNDLFSEFLDYDVLQLSDHNSMHPGI
jgi:hypothetical protein